MPLHINDIFRVFSQNYFKIILDSLTLTKEEAEQLEGLTRQGHSKIDIFRAGLRAALRNGKS